MSNTYKKLVVAEEDGHKSLLTVIPIEPREVVWHMQYTKDKRDKYTIESDGIHYIDDTLMYINHSCEPNCKIEGTMIMSIAPIPQYGDITIDYEVSESELAEPFECICGSQNCRGMIGE